MTRPAAALTVLYVLAAIAASALVLYLVGVNEYVLAGQDTRAVTALALAVYALPLLVAGVLVGLRPRRWTYALAALLGLIPLGPFLLTAWSARDAGLALALVLTALTVAAVLGSAALAISARRRHD